MASVELLNVSIDFPIYNVSTRSLKKSFLRLATGGIISKEASKHVCIRSLNKVTLSLQHGDRIGLIGHNGAGKSTFLRLLANIYEPTLGKIQVKGRVNPMLSLMQGIEVELTGYENIVQRGMILGLTRKQIKSKIPVIAEMTGLGDYLHMPVRTYSAGMMVRLAFAILTCIDPEILLIDEIFGAGDAAFMQTARTKLIELLDQSSIVVMATHSHDLIKEFCTKAILLNGGSVQYFGDVQTAFELYRIDSRNAG